MCNPAIAMAAFQMVGQSLAIRMQNQALTAEAQARAAGAVENANLNYAQLTAQQREIGAKAGQEVTLKLRQALRTRAMIRVAQAESGVAGGERDLSTVLTQAGEDIGVLQTNRDAAIGEAQMNKIMVQRGAEVQLKEAQYVADSRTPSWMAALQIASAGISGYASGRAMFGASGNTTVPSAPKPPSPVRSVKLLGGRFIIPQRSA